MIKTWAVGTPGKVGNWYQGEALAEVAAGMVAIPYEPEDGKPLPPFMISGNGGAVVPLPDDAIELAKLSRRRDAVAYRDLRQAGGCMTPLGRVDTDPEKSLGKITGAAAAAGLSLALGTPFAPKVWTMADNSQVTHTAAQLVAMGMAVVAHVDVCQMRCTAIKAAIDAAGSAAALAAIDITAGYPA